MRAWRPRRLRRGRAARLWVSLAALGAANCGHLPRSTWAIFRTPGGPSQQLSLTVDAHSAPRRRLRGRPASPRSIRAAARHARGRRRKPEPAGTDTVEEAVESGGLASTVVATVASAATTAVAVANNSSSGSSSETSVVDEVAELDHEDEEGSLQEEEGEEEGEEEEEEEEVEDGSLVNKEEEAATPLQEEAPLTKDNFQTQLELQRDLTLAVREARSPELDVVQLLQERDLLQDSLHVAMALRLLRLEDRNEEAIALFAAADEFCEPDLTVEAEILAVYGSMGRWTPVLDEFNRLKQRGLQPDRACYNCAMFALAHTDQQPRALELLKEMTQRQIVPDVACYEMALRCSNGNESPDVKLGLLRSMKANNLVPSQACYRRVLRSLASSSACEQSLNLLDEMRGAEIEVDEKSVYYVLRACITGLDADEAFKVALRLEADASIPFSELHYDMSISACECAGKWQEIIMLASRMGERGVSPDGITCNSVLRACVELGNWQAASDVLGSMKDGGVELDGLAYSTVLQACAQAEQWEEVLRLHDMIKDSESSLVRAEIAQPVIAALWELGRDEDARRFYHEATDRGWLRLWRRRRFGVGPAMLDTRRVVPQVANIAVDIALSEARQQGDTKDSGDLVFKGASTRKEAQDVVVVVNDEDIGGQGEVLEAVEGSTAAAVLEMARQVLGQKAKLECLRDPVACIRIPGSELEVQRVQEAIRDFMLGQKPGL